MFKELMYASGIIGIITCGTETIYRVKEWRNMFGSFYPIQSTYLIVASGLQVVVSFLVYMNVSRLKPKVLKGISVIYTAVLIGAIALRTKYNFFMPTVSEYTLYNVTSFFLCLETIIFALLWFNADPKTEESSVDVPLEQRRRPRRNDATASVHEYDGEIDYTLPSYSEVPAPPAYSKTLMEDVAISIPETSSSTYPRNSVLSDQPSHEYNTTDQIQPITTTNTRTT